MRVTSASTGVPQFEQNRTLGVTYAPQAEQVISFSTSLDIIQTKRGGHHERFRLFEAESEQSTDFVGGIGVYWLTSWRRPSGRRVMKTLRS